MVSLQVVPLKNDDVCVGVPTVKKSSFSPLFDIEIHPLFFHISSK